MNEQLGITFKDKYQDIENEQHMQHIEDINIEDMGEFKDTAKTGTGTCKVPDSTNS